MIVSAASAMAAGALTGPGALAVDFEAANASARNILIGLLGTAIVFIAVALAFRGRKADYKEVGQTAFVAVAAAAIAALGVQVALVPFGASVLNAFGL